jgi:hypothetical protein
MANLRAFYINPSESAKILKEPLFFFAQFAKVPVTARNEFRGL